MSLFNIGTEEWHNKNILSYENDNIEESDNQTFKSNDIINAQQKIREYIDLKRNYTITSPHF